MFMVWLASLDDCVCVQEHYKCKHILQQLRELNTSRLWLHSWTLNYDVCLWKVDERRRLSKDGVGRHVCLHVRFVPLQTAKELQVPALLPHTFKVLESYRPVCRFWFISRFFFSLKLIVCLGLQLVYNKCISLAPWYQPDTSCVLCNQFPLIGPFRVFAVYFTSCCTLFVCCVSLQLVWTLEAFVPLDLLCFCRHRTTFILSVCARPSGASASCTIGFFDGGDFFWHCHPKIIEEALQPFDRIRRKNTWI